MSVRREPCANRLRLCCMLRSIWCLFVGRVTLVGEDVVGEGCSGLTVTARTAVVVATLRYY